MRGHAQTESDEAVKIEKETKAAMAVLTDTETSTKTEEATRTEKVKKANKLKNA